MSRAEFLPFAVAFCGYLVHADVGACVVAVLAVFWRAFDTRGESGELFKV